MAAPRNEHLVVIMLEAVPPDQEFETWPPHITIVPWFPCDNDRRLDKLLRGIAEKHRPFTARAGEIEEWGGKDKFKVLKIEESAELQGLHRDVFKGLERNGFPIHQKDYMDEKYTPHVTLRDGLEYESERLYRGRWALKVDRFTLIRQARLRGSGRMIKTPVRDYELG